MKKANISINVIIYAILGLIVLVILIMIFSSQIRNAALEYFNIGENAANTAKGNQCVSLLALTSRKCSESAECGEGWRLIQPVDTWKDCTEESGKPHCCEKQ